MTKMIIIRGAPGSGKTTIAKTIPGALICEADQFFVDENEIYRFEKERLKEAHEFCQNKARRGIENGELVVVSNTFTKLWELQTYLDMTKDVLIFRAIANYENQHGVPEDVVERMKNTYEPHNDEIEIK